MRAKRFPVTMGEWFAWYDAEGHRLPSDLTSVSEAPAHTDHLVLRVPGGYLPSMRPDDTPCTDRHPMPWLCFDGARAFATWRAARDGVPWQLPTEWMWEKAARGVDRRTHSWGDDFDPARALTAETAGKPHIASVDLPTDDVGPYGLVHTCGMVRELCGNVFVKLGDIRAGEAISMDVSATPPPDGWYMARGGAYQTRSVHCRLAVRWVGRPRHRYGSTGVRLFAPFPEADRRP